ncbi:pilus assembly protein TadB [Blastococcus litoris]|uniref:pilus assembly protein TadB n=1 Tax=Blastococcus litoris TaxID=2171622 RepID=UPI000E305F2D|nr:pilus assembly protein TadB [Blastococcus litoris]
MSGALLVTAVAVLVWPDRELRRRARIAVARAEDLGRRPPAPATGPLAVAVASALVVGLVSTLLVGCLVGVLVLVGARLRAARAAVRRAEARVRSVTEGLGALGAELRSGRPIDAATQAAVAACADDECGAALARALRAPAAGVPGGVDPVLGAALDRISAGTLLSARTGASLAAVSAAVEDDLRAADRLRQELRTATAGPRASAMLLAGLPALGLAMGSGVGADPWRVLTTTGVGQVLLVVGVALELLGLLWSDRLVSRAVR